MQQASTAQPSSIAEYLNCKPECTLWRKDYCRHTAFAFEPVKLSVTGGGTSFNFKHTLTINRSADLLENLAIYFEVTPLFNGDIFQTSTAGYPEQIVGTETTGSAYADNANATNVGRVTVSTGGGAAATPTATMFTANQNLRDLVFAQRPYLVDYFALHVLSKLTFKIAQGTIDQLDPFMILAHYMQFSKSGGLESYADMLGGKPRHLTDAEWVTERQKRAGNTQVFWLNIPLWFANAPQYALPIVAMMYNDLTLELTFNTWENMRIVPAAVTGETIYLIDAPDTNNTATKYTYNILDMTTARGLLTPTITTQVVANYVYLDYQERRLFGRNINEYVGEAHQVVTPGNPPAGATSFAYNLYFNYPTTSITFYALDTRDATKEKFNTISGYGADGNDSFDSVKLTIQGSTRIDTLPPSYYRKVVYHRHCNHVVNAFRLYTIPFATALNAVDPSGAMHFQQVDTAQLVFGWDGSNPFKAKAPTNCQIYAFARYKNIFRTQLGVAGWKYAPGY